MSGVFPLIRVDILRNIQGLRKVFRFFDMPFLDFYRGCSLSKGDLELIPKAFDNKPIGVECEPEDIEHIIKQLIATGINVRGIYFHPKSPTEFARLSGITASYNEFSVVAMQLFTIANQQNLKLLERIVKNMPKLEIFSLEISLENPNLSLMETFRSLPSGLTHLLVKIYDKTNGKDYIDIRTIHHLAEAIKRIKSLKHIALYIHGKELQTNNFSYLIESLLYPSSLESLELSFYGVKNGIDVTYEWPSMVIEILDKLAGIKKLHLNFSSSYVSNILLHALIEKLRILKYLNELSLILPLENDGLENLDLLAQTIADLKHLRRLHLKIGSKASNLPLKRTFLEKLNESLASLRKLESLKIAFVNASVENSSTSLLPKVSYVSHPRKLSFSFPYSRLDGNYFDTLLPLIDVNNLRSFEFVLNITEIDFASIEKLLKILKNAKNLRDLFLVLKSPIISNFTEKFDKSPLKKLIIELLRNLKNLKSLWLEMKNVFISVLEITQAIKMIDSLEGILLRFDPSLITQQVFLEIIDIIGHLPELRGLTLGTIYHKHDIEMLNELFETVLRIRRLEVFRLLFEGSYQYFDLFELLEQRFVQNKYLKIIELVIKNPSSSKEHYDKIHESLKNLRKTLIKSGIRLYYMLE